MSNVASPRLARWCHSLVGSVQVHQRLDGTSSHWALVPNMTRQAVLVGGLSLGILLSQTKNCPATEAAPLELAWGAPRQCPQHADVTAQIQKLVGDTRERERSHPLSARGVIEPSRGQFDLTLWIQDGKRIGIRSIESTSCQSLGDAAAVVLSLLIRQRRELGRELSNEELSGSSTLGVPPGSNAQPNSQGAATPSSSPRATRSASPTDRVTTSQAAAPREPVNRELIRDVQAQETDPKGTSAKPGSKRRWRMLLAVPSLHLEYGTLPKASGGAGAALGVTLDAWQVFASFAYFARQTSHVSGDQGYDARFRSRALAGWVCRTWEKKPFEIAPCAQLTLNIADASASGDEITSATRFGTWLSVGAGAKASLHLRREIALVARLMGRLALDRPEYLLEDDPSGQKSLIHKVSIGALDLSIGCEWFF
jgi:hypothetical protein